MEIPSGQAPLHVFAERSDAARVLSELDAGVDPNLRTEWARETALSMCVSNAWREDKFAQGPTAATVECVRLLLARGASPNIHGGLGARIFPLHFAARWASSEVLGMLLEAGAEVNAVCDPEIRAEGADALGHRRRLLPRRAEDHGPRVRPQLRDLLLGEQACLCW